LALPLLGTLVAGYERPASCRRLGSRDGEERAD
jgi:hypothetical protein